MQLLLTTTIALILIVAAAQLCGRLAQTLGQPAVVGEMVAGVLLGPTAFGYLLPDFSARIFSTDVKQILYVMSMVGLSLYMFLVGVEHDGTRLVGKQRHLPLVLGLFGFALPVAIGMVAAGWLMHGLKPTDVSIEAYVLFIGVGLSITAFPMLARVLQDRGMIGTRFGATAIKIAAIDDALAWCALAVTNAVATHGTALDALYRTVLPSIALVALAFVVVPVLFRRSIQEAVARGVVDDRLLSSLLLLVFVASFVSDYVGLYSVFGSFIVGAALPSVPGFAALLQGRMLQVVRCLLLPIFFAYSGLNANIARALDASTISLFLILLVIAIGAKALPAFAVLRLYRWPIGEAVAMTGLMNARGLMILVYVTIGLSIGIIDRTVYSIMVLIAIATTAIAMPLYRTYFSEAREFEARFDADGQSGVSGLTIDMAETEDHVS